MLEGHRNKRRVRPDQLTYLDTCEFNGNESVAKFPSVILGRKVMA